MSESSLSVTPGSGLDLSTISRTIDSETRHFQRVLPGDGDLATYTAIARNIAVATSGDHVIMLQADGTNHVRVRRITIRQSALAGAANRLDLRVLRVNTAGTGGSSVSGRPFDLADTGPYAGTIATLPSSKGTESAELLSLPLGVVSAQPVNALNSVEWRWSGGDTKPIVFGTATSQGIVVKVQTGVATVTVDVEIEFALSTWA